MGRPKGSKNRPKTNLDAFDSAPKQTPSNSSISISKRISGEAFLVDGAMLKRWLLGVRANHIEENKKPDEKYVHVLDEIIEYINRMEHVSNGTNK